MGRVVNDNCGVMPATFFEKLASCARIDPITEDVFVNTVCYDVDCEDADSAIVCGNGVIDAQQWCADNLFAVDSCGNLGLKIGYCEKEPQ